MKNRNYIIAGTVLPVFIFISSVAAQVPVRQEPRHKVVLENKFVRLIEVYIASHDTTLYHIHAEPSVVVFLNHARIGSQVTGGQPVIAEVKPGQTSYAAYDEKPVTHRVWNQGDSVYHVLDIELLHKKGDKDSCEIFSGAGVNLQWQEKLVRLYKIDLSAGKPFQVRKSNCAYLLIDISGNIQSFFNNREHHLTQGTTFFYPPEANIRFSSINQEPSTCILLELK